jgi:hypothetical protein
VETGRGPRVLDAEWEDRKTASENLDDRSAGSKPDCASVTISAWANTPPRGEAGGTGWGALESPGMCLLEAEKFWDSKFF